MKLSEKPQTYDGLRDLCIREQFLDSSPVDLSTNLRERKLPTLDEVAQSADLFLTARKRELSNSVKPVTFNSQSKTTVAKKPEYLHVIFARGNDIVQASVEAIM